jgi:hypothetical protein
MGNLGQGKKNLSQVKKNLSQGTVYNMFHVVIHRCRKIEITLRRIVFHRLKLLGVIIIYIEVLKILRKSNVLRQPKRKLLLNFENGVVRLSSFCPSV